MRTVISTLVITSLAFVLCGFTAAHEVISVPGSCESSYSYLSCGEGCGPQVNLTFKCCNGGSSPDCCQRLCYNVTCVPDAGSSTSCSGSATTHSVGNSYAGPCQANGTCAGKPIWWESPVPTPVPVE